MSGPKEGWPVSEISKTPQSVGEERKVNVAVAGVTTKSGISTVIEIGKFSRLGRLLRVTSWVKRFLYYSQSTAKGTERRKTMLSGSKIADAMAALPDLRVRQSAPFSKVGIDFAGPLFVKSKTGEMVKSYFALFTCCVTRTVHLDLVADLTVTTFLRCLRRFTARRGTLSLIISDNAMTFNESAKVIKQLYDNEEVSAHLESNRIDWRFILERAPWWSGFYERMIGTVKRCLRKVLGNAKLNADELLTVLTELEATLNSHPLTYEYGAEMLTPSHLIYGRRLLSLPDEVRNDEEESGTGFLRRFRFLARLRIHFWNWRRKEYLADSREHHGSKEKGLSKVSEGNVVLVHEDHVKRSNWKMGKVVEQIVGKDGVVRGAKLRMITKGKPIIVNRAVQKLYPLEVSSAVKEVRENENGQRNTNLVGNAGEQVIPRREIPRGAAALDSRWKTQAKLDHWSVLLFPSA